MEIQQDLHTKRKKESLFCVSEREREREIERERDFLGMQVSEESKI